MRINQYAVAVVVGLVLASPAAAQQGAMVKGLPFAGCWAPADGLSSRNRICLTPTSTAMLEFTSITADGKVTESQLSLDGTRVPMKSEGCEGWEEGRLTSDGERIIVSAEVTCGNEPKQMRATTFSITPAGYLLQATGTGLSMVASTQIRMYSVVESYAGIPATTRESLMPYLVPAERERRSIRSNAVSAADLLEFEKMEVAPALIDLMVASTYPKSFVIDGMGEIASAEREQGNAPRRPLNAHPVMFMNGYPMLSMYDWQMMYECQRVGFSCPIGMYGYAANGYGYGIYASRYGYGSYGGFGGYGGYGGYYPYGIPVVVRPVQPGSSGPGGRAIRGRGYTQDGTSSSGGTASPRSSVSAPSSSGASSQSGGSSGASSSSGSSSSGSSARTAKPRP